VIRERRKAPTASKSAAQRWAEARERLLLVNGKPDRVKEVLRLPTTLREFAPRFLEGHAKANRLKASGVASKECALRIHLVPALGDKPLAAITTEDVQHLKSALSAKSPKTVNNVLTVLNVLMRTAVEWDVIERVPCSIKMLRTPRTEASFYEFDQFERLIEASAREPQAHLVVLLGGEAGLRRGEMIALEWTDVILTKRQLCVARSDWRGHMSTPKGGRIRYVPLTKRLAGRAAGGETPSRSTCALRRRRETADAEGGPGDDATGRTASQRETGTSHPASSCRRERFRSSPVTRISGRRSGTCT
jgi:integrase